MTGGRHLISALNPHNRLYDMQVSHFAKIALAALGRSGYPSAPVGQPLSFEVARWIVPLFGIESFSLWF
jgi:hypothetical protein